MTFDLKAYLARIGIESVAPTIEGLRQLQQAQQSTIPFENIGPFTGMVPNLAPDAVFRKLVVEKRGGYCVELNGLFGDALVALGFHAQPILGRVRLGAPVGGPRAHLAWIVTIDGEEWLADTGFGGPGPRYPVKAVIDVVQHEGHESFRFVLDRATDELVLERVEPDGWFAIYSFDHYPVVAGDIDAANFLSAVWAERSPFPHNLLLNIRTAEGRASLFNKTATAVDGMGKVNQWVIASQGEFRGVLKDMFALDLGNDEVVGLWQRLEAGAVGVAA